MSRLTLRVFLSTGGSYAKTADRLQMHKNTVHYRSTQLLGGTPRFVLSTSGHIQALVNPPAEESRATYRVADEHPQAPAAWAEQAATRRGSWWADYDEWLAARSGALKPPPKRLGGGGYKATAKAPGSYVHAG